MNRQKINALLAALIETLEEVGDAGAPRGVLYAALMGEVDLGGYESVEHLLLAGELARREGDVLRITPKGSEIAAKIAEARAKLAAEAVQ